MKNNTVLFRIFFTNFLDFLSFSVIIPVLPFIFSTDESSIFRNDFTKEQLTLLYGLLLGFAALASFIGAPILGILSDKIGRKKILLYSNIIHVLAYLLTLLGVYSVSLLLIFLGRIVPGLISNTVNTVQAAIADVSDEQSKAKNFGITGVAFGLGFIGGLLIVVLLSAYDWFSHSMAFILAAILGTVNVFYIWLQFPETLNLDKQQAHQKIQLWTGFDNIRRAFTSAKFQLFFLSIFMLTVGFAFFTQFLQYYLMDKFHMDLQQVGLIFIYIGVCVVITQGVFLRPISNRFPPKQVLKVCIFMFMLSYLLLLLPQTVAQLYMAIPVMLFFQGITFPTSLAVVSNLVNDRIQGEIIGINQSVQALANAIPPILFGFAVGFNPSFPLYFGTVCSFFGWLMFLGFLKKAEDK